jgi:hypothetical protein
MDQMSRTPLPSERMFLGSEDRKHCDSSMKALLLSKYKHLEIAFLNGLSLLPSRRPALA